MRSVNDRFWADSWVRNLNPLDRYLFLYLLTNAHSTWCGVYELELGMMAFESGVEKEELVNSMLPRLAPKIHYIDGWVCVPNWARYHMSENGSLSPQQKKGMEDAMRKVPERIREKMHTLGIPYTYPMVRGSASASSFTSSSASTRAASDKLKEDAEKQNTKAREKARKQLEEKGILAPKKRKRVWLGKLNH